MALTRFRLQLTEQVRSSNGPKAVAASLLLPMAYAPARHALPAVDRFLRFAPRSRMARPAYHRALDLARTLPLSDRPLALERSIILKTPAPQGGERGLLLTSFESELAKLARFAPLDDVTESYDVLFLPTWQPFYSIPLYQYVARADRPLLLMPSSGSDYELCRRRHKDMLALPFQASSWVNPAFYQPPPVKDIDIVMVANFSTYKRHWHLFRALRDLPEQLRVVLVGVPLRGRTRETLIEEAKAFGTQDRFEIHESPPNEVVSDFLSRAKVFLALSAKEGSYISIAEALFSDTPVGVYRNAAIGSKDYINEQTGMLFDPHTPLGPQVLAFLQRADSYSPASWARANIASTITSERLNQHLCSLAAERGEPWSENMAPVYCRHFRFYYERATDEEKFAPAYARFIADYGITIPRPNPVAP